LGTTGLDDFCFKCVNVKDLSAVISVILVIYNGQANVERGLVKILLLAYCLLPLFKNG